MIQRMEARPDRKWQKALAELYSGMTRALIDGWHDVAAAASKHERVPAARAGRRRKAG